MFIFSTFSIPAKSSAKWRYFDIKRENKNKTVVNHGEVTKLLLEPFHGNASR